MAARSATGCRVGPAANELPRAAINTGPCWQLYRFRARWYGLLYAADIVLRRYTYDGIGLSLPTGPSGPTPPHPEPPGAAHGPEIPGDRHADQHPDGHREDGDAGDDQVLCSTGHTHRQAGHSPEAE